MLKNKETTICATCVMDTTDPNITFFENGTCNHCKAAVKRFKDINNIDPTRKDIQLKKIVEQIKSTGQNKKYDCLIGISGGVDSSYLAWITKELGLRPLAVHIDNGWNTELAVKNIENIVNKLSIDLKTIVINWEEFKALQKAFLKASVVDLEMLSDNAITVGLMKLAKKERIKYFLSGTNISAESIMPASWYYFCKYDSLNIRSIYKIFGEKVPLKSYPIFNLFEYITHRFFNPIVEIPLLNYIEYVKKDAMKVLEEKLNWVDYGGKHYESKITQFYQAYILPKKFNVDKRKAHLSSLICSGQITRDYALTVLKEPLYTSKNLEMDQEYFLKKLELGKSEFENILSEKPKSHWDYPSYEKIISKLVKIKKTLIWKK